MTLYFRVGMQPPQQALSSALPPSWKALFLAEIGVSGLQVLFGLAILFGLRRPGLWGACATWVLEPVLSQASNLVSQVPGQSLPNGLIVVNAALAGAAALAAWHAGEAQWPQDRRPGVLRWAALALEVAFAGVVIALASQVWVGHGAPPREAPPPLGRADASWPGPAAFLEPALANLDGGREPVLAEDGRAGTVVHYWSDWGKGRRAVQEMDAAAALLGPDGVRVVHVSVRLASPKQVRERLQAWGSPPARPARHLVAERDGTWAALHAQLEEEGRDLSMFDLPLALVLDAQGRVVDAWTGVQPPDTVRVRALAALRRAGAR